MSVVQPMVLSGLEVWPLVEGGKGVAVSSGRSAGAWAAAGGVGTFSGVNADALDEQRRATCPLVFRGRDRLERHEELIAYSIQGGISQARIAHATRAGRRPHPHERALGDGRPASACCRACSKAPRA